MHTTERTRSMMTLVALALAVAVAYVGLIHALADFSVRW
jgi:hypothetical protein